ncbi:MULTISPECIES: MBL fold metallo-hydrolase [Bacteria]|uniref:MBL fold metallo-hydrolase n=1 Tax=Bacteria TaxID=2 RepID=UPI003C79B645
MIINRYYIDCLSQASYLLGDERSGQALLVDPRRDVADYLHDADEADLRIVGVMNTHFHADFLAGHLEVAEATGAWIGYGAKAEADYPIRRFAHGDRLRLGDLEIEVLETPGHTWESISLLVHEPGRGEPSAVFTGDALFIGDVGRPDLAVAVGADPRELAQAMHRTVSLFRGLPDSVRVFPGHGAGSACGRNLSDAPESTIGEQRATNPALQPLSEEEFVDRLLQGQPSIPRYFSQDAIANRRVHPLLDTTAPAPIAPEAVPAGTLLIDGRDAARFSLGTLPAAINVDLNGRFAETVGMFADLADEVVVVVSEDRAAEARTRLGRVGIDNVLGYVSEEALLDSALVEAAPRVQPENVQDLLAQDSVVFVDVRNPGEYASGGIPGAVRIPLAELASRAAEIGRNRPIVAYCASGRRSSTAASYLRGTGLAATDLAGGYAALRS